MAARVALVCLLGVAAMGAQDVGELVRDGVAALDAQDFVSARDKLEAAAELAPADGLIWLALARIYQLSAHQARAEASLDRAHALADGQPELRRALALYAEQEGRFADAAKWESEYNPEDGESLARAAAYFLQAGQNEQAVEYGEKAAAKLDTGRVRNLLGKAYSEAGRGEEAARELSRAVELDPFNEEFHYDRGYQYLRVQDFKRALDSFLESRKAFDKSPRVELGIGIAFFGNGRFDEAVDAFLRAAEFAPSSAQAHYFLGRMLHRASARIDEVLARFENFMKAEPDRYLGPLLYAQGLMAKMGDERNPAVMKRAEELLLEARARRPDFWETHYELGALMAKQRRYSEARAELALAARQNPASSKIRQTLADVYLELGQTALAEAEREKYAELLEIEKQGGGADGGVTLGPGVE